MISEKENQELKFESAPKSKKLVKYTFQSRLKFQIKHMKKSIAINDIPGKELYGLLTSAVIPRPIAFASTVDKDGNVNLSPFSYFNLFSSNPPILVFSPVRRSADGTTKDTYQNLKEVPEVVINIVNYEIVQQMSLASTGYPKGVNEFEKSGLTEGESVKVKPPRVLEAPVAFECKVNQIIELGDQGGAGSLMICEIVHMHLEEDILGTDGKIDPFKLDAVARLGGSYYSRVNEVSIFDIAKPISSIGIGVDELPESYRAYFSGSELAQLGTINELPERTEELDIETIDRAKHLLSEGDVLEAWEVLRG